MENEVNVIELLNNYFEGVITKKEMVSLVKIFRNDVERAKKEVIKEIKDSEDVSIEFLEKFNSITVKVFDNTLQKAYNNRVDNNEMMKYVYGNVKNDLTQLIREKSLNSNQ